MPNNSKKEPPLNPDEHGLDKTTEHSENAERKRRDNGEYKGVIMPIPVTSVELPGDYADFLKQIKQRVNLPVCLKYGAGRWSKNICVYPSLSVVLVS